MASFNDPNPETVRALLQAMTGRHVLVVGDGMLDGYIYGTSSRISPEAPVQIIQVDREEYLLGGAANVAKCLVMLGANVSLCCVVGTDGPGERFIEEARNLRMDTRLVFRAGGRSTTVKTRVVAGRQHVVRLDRDNRVSYPQDLAENIARAVSTAAAQADAVLLSDYDKGVLVPAVAAAAIQGAGKRPVFVDPKGLNWRTRFHGATVLKPNWPEAQMAVAPRDSAVLSLVPSADDHAAEELAAQIRCGVGAQNVILTRGNVGLSVSAADGSSYSFQSRTVNVRDEAGAGDVVAAVATLALAGGAPLPLAAWLGNLAAGIKVAKFGTLAVSDHEIMEAMGESHPTSQRKLLTARQAVEYAAAMRGSGRKVVFTNGCFDILHLGHVTLLERARQLGDALIVAINTDASVRRLKGPDRPVNPQSDRSRVISSLACVDAVVLFDDDTPLELIRQIKPDVLCKGGDYKSKQEVVGWDVAESYGGQVVLIDLVAGHSTTNVINRMREK